MRSTRLPGKVLKDIRGEPMLARVVGRLSRSSLLDAVVVATTTRAADKPIVDLCGARGWHCFRGSEGDVLARYYFAALESHADVVVRVTSDCPLVDAGVVDRVASEFLQNGKLDYASNTVDPRTFPRGLDVEVLSLGALERAWCEDGNPTWREHVTPYIYRNPDRFRVRSVTNAPDCSHLRWTVDTPEDLELVRTVYRYFADDGFTWQEVLDAFARNPDWVEINRYVTQRELP